jgi:hypothetical protein
MEVDSARERRIRLRFFDTLQSGYEKRRLAVASSVQAHERRLRGSTGSRTEVTNLGEEKATRGSAAGRAGDRDAAWNGLVGCTNPWSRAVRVRLRLASVCSSGLGWETAWRDEASRGAPATGEGKPLKAEAQGRYRHETRPERLRAE